MATIDDYNDFEKWYDSHLAGFHSCHFSDKEIAFSAWSEQRQLVIELLEQLKRYEKGPEMFTSAELIKDLAKDFFDKVMASRERILEAFVAEAGLKPSECEQVIQYRPDGAIFFVRERTKICSEDSLACTCTVDSICEFHSEQRYKDTDSNRTGYPEPAGVEQGNNSNVDFAIPLIACVECKRGLAFPITIVSKDQCPRCLEEKKGEEFGGDCQAPYVGEKWCNCPEHRKEPE